MSEWYDADYDGPTLGADGCGYEYDDEGPSLEAIKRAVAKGRICRECSTEFVKQHGKETACVFCWSRLSLEEQQMVQKATHDEKNSAGWAAINRKKKARRK